MNTNRTKTKTVARILLGSMLVTTGIGHLSFLRREFRGQVPNWVPLNTDDTVVCSGIAEIALGVSLIAASGKHKPTLGKITALFFTAVFPGNVAQFVHHRNAFGLDTDNKRLARLFVQPVLIYWALKSTSNQ